jgi:hypothetical protein
MGTGHVFTNEDWKKGCAVRHCLVCIRLHGSSCEDVFTSTTSVLSKSMPCVVLIQYSFAVGLCFCSLVSLISFELLMEM